MGVHSWGLLVISGCLVGCAGPERREATELLKRAERATNESRFPQAIALAERALRLREEALGPEHPAVAEALYSLSSVYWHLGVPAKIEPLLLRALKIRVKALGPRHPAVGEVLTSLGDTYDLQGSFARAEPFYLRGLRIREEALGPHHPDVANSLNELAVGYQYQGEYARAEPLFLRALAIYEKEGPAGAGVAQVQNNLALLYTKAGAYAQAESRYRSALAIWEKMGHPAYNTTLNNLAMLYVEQGEYDRAEPLLLRVLERSEKTSGRDHPGHATPLNNLAEVYRGRGEYARAEPLYLQAMRLYETALPDSPSLAKIQTSLAALYLAQREHDRAESLFLRALRLYERTTGPLHPDVAALLGDLAQLHLAQGQPRRALPYAARSFLAREHFLRAESAALSETRWESLFQRQQSDHEARYSLARALPADPEVRRLLLLMTLLHKGRSLQEATAQFQAMRRALSTSEQAARFDRLLALRGQIANLIWHPRSAPAFRKSLDGTIAEAAALEEALAKDSQRFRDLRLPPPDQVIPQIADRLPRDAVLVEYVTYRPYRFTARGTESPWAPPRYLALMLHGDRRIDLLDLGAAAAIDDGVKRLHGQVTAKPPRDAAAAGQVLYRLVLAPLLPHLRGRKHLLISPESQLHLVNFSALHDGRDYLLGRWSFTYLSSGRSLLLPPPPEGSPGTAVVLADPAFTAPAPAADPLATRDVGRGLRAGLAGLTRLTGAQREASDLRRLLTANKLRVSLLTDTHATAAALLQIKAPDILHIATHGVFYEANEMNAVRGATARAVTMADNPHLAPLPDSPLTRSALVLAGTPGATGEDQDYRLVTALEVAGMDLRGTQLAVLSACDTGRGDIRPIQGVYGLRRAFLIAGAETVVTSLWHVSDQDTRDLMVSFYENVLAGQGRGRAMEQAAQAMRQRHPQPYYWAPFLVIGQDGPLR